LAKNIISFVVRDY